MRKTLSATTLMLGLLLSSPASAQSIGSACSNPGNETATTKSSIAAQGVLICALDASGQSIWEPIGQGLPTYDQGQTCSNVGQFRYNTSTNAPQYCNSVGRWTGFSASEFQPNKTAGTVGVSPCTAMTDANANPYIVLQGLGGPEMIPGTIYYSATPVVTAGRAPTTDPVVICNLTGAGLTVMHSNPPSSELYPWQ